MLKILDHHQEANTRFIVFETPDGEVHRRAFSMDKVSEAEARREIRAEFTQRFSNRKELGGVGTEV